MNLKKKNAEGLQEHIQLCFVTKELLRISESGISCGFVCFDFRLFGPRNVSVLFHFTELRSQPHLDS